MTSVSRHRTTPAAPGAVWTVLADFDAISAWAPNVDHSCALSSPPSGPDASRRVQAGRWTLVEQVTSWDPGRRLAYRIDGLPARLGRIVSEWTVEPADTGSTVTLTTTVDIGHRPDQRLLERVVARRLAATSDTMLAGLVDHLATSP